MFIELSVEGVPPFDDLSKQNKSEKMNRSHLLLAVIHGYFHRLYGGDRMGYKGTRGCKVMLKEKRFSNYLLPNRPSTMCLLSPGARASTTHLNWIIIGL